MENTNVSRWKRVALRADLHGTVEKTILEHPELGYGSVTAFVEDATRRRVEDLR